MYNNAESNNEQLPSDLIKKMLKSKKEMYKRYWLRQTLDNKWLFIDKETMKTKNILTFKELPDKYFDKVRNKIVNSSNSAFVLIIMDKMYKRSCVDLSGWTGRKCRSKKCIKCLTKIVAVPIKNVVEPNYDRKYVLSHKDEFKIMFKCKLYDITFPEYFEIEYIDAKAVKDMSLHKRNEYIRILLSKGIPDNKVREYLGISKKQLWRIKNYKMAGDKPK